ncbi:hypothetical protein [Croceicoccus sp. BE223]|uniref:hypothetical protein n=1 Tax=Croceicoccus sp. BE223 TaxID=2817716 RepID=UPI0028678687|nr:hypothetical protein [Croceicoccus sp. BE223]MDR7100974.1 hypothetical protein [Croceicoccus sp. BE223]
MATIADGGLSRGGEHAERRFFLILSVIMVLLVVAGFSMNLALGRSSFAVPVIYHLHAVVFMGWLALYLAQVALVAGNNVALHRRLGMLALGWAPLMVVLGFAVMFTSMRRTGGPFFFDQNEFMLSNTLQLILFMAMVLWALRVRRHIGWHRRIMLIAMAILTGPGLGRLLPMPLMIPHAWRIMIAMTMIFPVIGMIRDWRKRGAVHPAWLWGVGLVFGAQVLADLVAYSPLGLSLTEWVLAGTPGAERPMHAFLPPGFAM